LISKTKPQIITEAEKESPEQTIVDKSSPWSRTTSDTDTGGHVKNKKNRSVPTKTTTATKTKSSKAKKNDG
jgi:hypothetical protein